MRVEWIAIMLALGAAAVSGQGAARGADNSGSAPGTEGSARNGSHGSPLLEEIVVTATKREESVQKLPEAVTAITSDEIDNLNAQSFEDYFRAVPGLMMNSAPGGTRPFDFSLRGISDFSDIAPQQTSATVGQYLDEIPITAAGLQIDPRLIDIERIEILRGPQGTYFGEDSLGGTIRVITKKPDLSSLAGYAEARISNTDHGGMNNSESGMINLPLWDQKLGVRLSGFGAYDSGFIDSLNTDCSAAGCTILGVHQRNINPATAAGGRAMLLFKPVDWLSVLGEFIHSDSVAHEAAFYEPKVGKLAIASPDLNSQVVKDHDNLYNLTATAELGWAQVVSASSWGRRDSTAYQTPPDTTLFSFDSFAQELRLVSAQDKSSRWDYVLGLYYSRNTQGTELAGTGLGGSFSTAVIQEHFEEKAMFGEVGLKLTQRLSARLGLREQQVDYDNFQAPSANVRPPRTSGRNTPTTGRVIASYELTGNAMTYASVSRGFRKGGLNTSYYDSFTQQPNPNVPLSFKPDTTTNYELGWKFTFPALRATLNAALYHIVWSDIQVIGLAPVPGAPGPQPVQYYHNAGSAKVDGFELEGGMQLLEGLRAQLSFSAMNPVITSNGPLPQDNPAAGYYARPYCERGCPAREGDRIPFVSKFSGSLTLNYRRKITSSGLDGFAVLSEQYIGPRNTDFASNWEGPSQAPVLGCPVVGPMGPCPVPLQPVKRTETGDRNSQFATMHGYTLTNLQLGIENARWRVALYADNLFDIRGQTLIAPASVPFGGGDEVLVGRPRTFGAWVRYTF
jgi:outer membrane receptor protein involved in Fe transport